MAKANKSKKSKAYAGDESPLVNNPFAALLGGDEPPADEEDEPVEDLPEPPRAEAAPVAAKPKGRVVVRREKKGRGGKTVTIVEGLSPGLGAELLPRLKRELGCSAKAEGAQLVVGTSDHARVQRWLEAAGVDKTVLGN